MRGHGRPCGIWGKVGSVIKGGNGYFWRGSEGGVFLKALSEGKAERQGGKAPTNR